MLYGEVRYKTIEIVGKYMDKEVLIDRPSEWLSEHDEVHIENFGKREILTANRHGDLQVGDESSPLTVNIEDPGVTVL